MILIAILVLEVGCSRPKTPELLRIDRVGPGLIEGGVELRVEGDGFPEGREAEVVLTGVLYSPGREPQKVRVELEGQARSPALILAEIREDRLLSMTSGAGHATFRGRAWVGFQPQRSGAPPLVGQSEKVVVDFVPRTTSDAEAAARFASFLGLTLGAGLEVEGIVPGSEAELAGLEPGDHLLELDGVRLLTPSEFVPAPRGAFSRLRLERPGFSGTSELSVARKGFLALDPAVTFRILLACLAVCLGLLLAAHPPRLLVWLCFPSAASKKAPLAERAPSVFASCTVTLCVYWLLLRLPGGLDLDLVLLSSAGAIALLISGFLEGGRSSRPERGFGLVGALAGFLSAALYLTPFLLAVALGAATVGSLGLLDAQRAQDLGPAGWLLFRSPWMLVLGLLALGALLPQAGRRPPCEGIGASRRRWGVVAGLQQVGTFLLVGLWVILFLGGAAGFDAESWRAFAMLALKVVSVSGLLDWARARSGQVRRAEGWKLIGLALIAGSLLASALGMTLHLITEVPSYEEHLRSFSLYVGLAVLLLLPVAMSRSLTHQGRRTDPWI